MERTTLAMSTDKAPATAAPVTNQNSASTSQDGDTLPAEIKVAEERVRDEGARAQNIDRISKLALFLYVVVTGLVAWTTVASNKANGRLRQSESLLNNLQKTKIAADADRKLKVDTQRVRDDAASALVLKAEEVRGEAGKKIEDAKADAGVKIEQARADAARQIGDVQKDVTAQQERAIKAEKDLAELKARVAWRTITPDQRAKFLAEIKSAPKGQITVLAPDGDPEAVTFANELIALITEAGWTVKAAPMTPVGSTPIGLNFLFPRMGELKLGDPLFHAARLERAIEIIDPETAVTEDKKLPEDSVVLWVGHKRRPKP